MRTPALSLILALLSVACSEGGGGDVPDVLLAPDSASVDLGTTADAGDRGDVALEATDVGSAPVTLQLPDETYNYADPTIPDHFRVETLGFHAQQPLMDDDNTPADNPTTDHGATLGRVLFYDTNLSINSTVACASCHKAANGFSDDRVLSEGFDGGETGRHSMGLTNARFYRSGRFFWDQRAATLEDQVLMPLQDQVEMGMTLEEVVARVGEGAHYAPLFAAAFGDDEITTERISRALAQFVRSMISTGSKYDVGRAQVARRDLDFPNFTDEENRGKQLFVLPPPRGGLGCFVCHQGEGFIGVEATNNGLDATAEADRGYGEVTDRPRDEGTFKPPSLRNVAIRAPYMHDGRFADLNAVITHYSDNIQPNPNLGAPFFSQNGQVAQIGLSIADKRALRAFLLTLTDMEMVEDPKFSDPFVRE